MGGAGGAGSDRGDGAGLSWFDEVEVPERRGAPRPSPKDAAPPPSAAPRRRSARPAAVEVLLHAARHEEGTAGRSASLDEFAQIAALSCDATFGVVTLAAEDGAYVVGWHSPEDADAPSAKEPGRTLTGLLLEALAGRGDLAPPPGPDGVLVVPDAARSPRPPDHAARRGLRFFAAAPLLLPPPVGASDGTPEAVGALCVAGPEPRPEGLSPSERRALTLLAARAAAHLAGVREAQRAARAEREADQARKRAEEAYAESQRFLRRLTDATANILYIEDLRGHRTLFFNRTLADALGYTPEEMRALGPSALESLVHPDDLAAFRGRAGRFADARDGDVLETEYRLRHASGEWRWIGAYDTPFSRDEVTGGVTQILGTAHDVTERLRTEAFLKDQAEEVARALRSAQAESRLMSEFVASMSHEIRTPLNGIVGTTGLLFNTELTAHQRELAETARSSAEALLSIVNDILDYSKIEAGRVTIEATPFDLSEVVDEVVQMVASGSQRDRHAAPGGDAAQRGEIEFLTHYAPGAPRRFVGDAGRVRQILLNLVGNAVKFTHRGAIVVHVECEDVDPGTGVAHLWIAVEDTGIGIEPDKIEYIFEKFAQADASTTRRYGGTGLGLPISRQLAELMGGTLGATSTPGEGSTFCLTLPLPLDPEAPAPHPAPRPDPDGVRALLVSDNPFLAGMVRDCLLPYGFRSESFLSGASALAAVADARDSGDPFGLILIDHQAGSGGLDGPAFLSEMKRVADIHPPLVPAHFLLVPAGADPADEAALRAAARAAGFIGCLPRPISQSRLHDTLVAALGSDFATPRVPVEATGTAVRGVQAEGRRRRAARANVPTRRRRESGAGGAGGVGATAPPRVRVLVAEDNAVNQRVALLMLAELDCHADLVGNGRECVRMLEMLPYDLVLMDCHMPEMDGFEAAREIRRREAGSGAALATAPGSRLPIVALTANTMPGDRERCLTAGMNGYLSKPVRVEDLAHALEEHVPAYAAAVGADGGAATAPGAGAVAAPDGPFDPVSLSERLGDDPEIVQGFAELVAAECLKMTAAIRSALAASDAEALVKASHALKGAMMTLGAPAVTEAARRMEELGKAGRLADADAHLLDLEAELTTLRAALAAFARSAELKAG